VSYAPDGRGLAADDFDDDEIEWEDPNLSAEGDGLSPIEALVDEGSDLFDDDDDFEDEDDR
jgi:hypothetical protein